MDVDKLLKERAIRDEKADAFDTLMRVCYGLAPHEGGKPVRLAHTLGEEFTRLKRDAGIATKSIGTLSENLRVQEAMVEELSKRLREVAPYALAGVAKTEAGKGVE